MSTKTTKKTLVIEDVYKKRDMHEAVLKEPDMWMGSIYSDKKELWVYDDIMECMVKKEIEYIPGLYKIYDEILVNARDQSIRDKTCRTIKVNIDKDIGKITVWNDGAGLPVEIHKEYNIYVPELTFANLLTSANYDQKGKITGGKNGLGAKLANIYSTEFQIKIVDSKNKKFYDQICQDNMYKINKPIIKNSNDNSYVEISFIPDYKKFGLKGITDDIVALFYKRVYDLAGCTNKNVKVYLNDKEIKIKSFEDYIGLFYNKKNLIYQEINNRWRVGAIFDPTSGFKHISFVNGISTFQGGTHVAYITDQICKKVIEYIKTKNKKITVKASHVRENLTILIDCVIEDPSFNSQTKELLGSKVCDYGSSCEIDDTFVKNLLDTGMMDEVVRLAQFKEESELKKTDGKKVTSLNDIPKYERAIWAGTRKAKYCRLILAEGDSAKSFVLSGLEIIGREKYGVFPLKGKPINVRDATINKLKNNAEFINIKKILGLKQGKKYTDVSQLRYGGIIILTDADADGSHIKGLLINMLHMFWPSLLKIDGFIQSMATPIIKVFKKTDKKKTNPNIFYTITDYKNWITEIGKDVDKWSKPKYYKGLGTSTEKEAKECFNDFENKVINYIWEISNNDTSEKTNNVEENDDLSKDSKEEENNEENEEDEDDVNINDLDSKSFNSISLAFEKTKSNERKKWLMNYNKNNVIDNYAGNIPISDFFDKDFIHFSNYDNIRSIPSLCDGFKPSLRKILYASFKKKIETDEIKVAQLGAYVAEVTDYHHGENSLYGAIIGMAQNFVGSNNINLLQPDGAFGSRRKGGDDSASPRYIFTKLNNLTKLIFKEEDEAVLIKQYEDDNENNHEIEPEYYCPILPLVLINGACGIGTGFSTFIPCFNPKDVADNILKMLHGKDPTNISPWYKGFNGKIKKIINEKNKKDVKYETSGLYEVIDENILKIIELPIGVWTENYIEDFLKKCLICDKKKDSSSNEFLTDIQNNSGNNTINIQLTFQGKKLQSMIKKGTIEKDLKLTSTVSLTNMYLYNQQGQICKFDSIDDIFYDFYVFRLEVYKKRKAYMIKHLENKMNIYNYKVKFIEDYINDRIILKNKTGNEVINKLQDMKYPKLSNDAYANDENKSYNYLISMELWSLTKEKIIDLNKQYDKAKEEYDIYLKTSEEEIWEKEIKTFIEKYEKWFEECNDEQDNKKTKNNKTKVDKSKTINVKAKTKK